MGAVAAAGAAVVEEEELGWAGVARVAGEREGGCGASNQR